MKTLSRITALIFIALALVGPVRPAFAVGTVTYDPAVYAQVTTLLAQVKEMYANAKQQLDQISQVQKTIREAHEAYDSLSNLDLKSFSDGFQPHNIKTNRDKINALRADLSRMESAGDRSTSYIQSQYGRIANLENLLTLQAASRANTARASEKVNPATSAQITAQSTAALAALAATQEQRAQQEELARINARIAESEAIFNTRGLYNAMGGKKPEIVP
jgi:uncharacterized phage infection (PIP) family protein YhgE